MRFTKIKKNIRFYFEKYKKIEAIEKKYKNKNPKIISKINKVKINFESSKNPIVSIIIPFYNEEDYTWNCLLHLHKNLKKTYPFEIIIIDDNSTEKCDFSLIEGIKIIRNNQNLGFLKNINKGIELSIGEYVYILNNDTEVEENFLDELFNVFKNFSNVGAVGSLLKNADETLQEAGSLFMKNCNISQINFKKLYNPEINYIHKVDYCSGCSLLFKKHDDFGKINFFDEQFVPAYFEETDFCFQLKYNQKKDIYFTPFSKVLHFNGITYNSSKNKNESAMERKAVLFEKNLKKFKLKWKEQIDSIQSTKIETRILELYNNKSIVFFVGQIPEPDKDSGSNRLKEIIIAYIDLGYHITLITNKIFFDEPYTAFFQRMGVQVFYQHKKNKGLSHFINKQELTPNIAWFYNPAVFLEYYKIAKKYFHNAKFVYDMVDIHHLRFKRAFELDPSQKKMIKDYKKFKLLETKATELADYIIPISESDKKYMAQFCKEDKLITISNIHYPKIEKKNTLAFNQRKDLLFIGSVHAPNIDSLYYLYNEIMPIVWEKLPIVKVNIIGNVNEKINDIIHEKFIFHGYVPNIEDYFISNKLMIAPLRYGAGVKGKVGQSFEYYLPVITTTIGGEGMNLINKQNALIEDSASGFANAIIELYSNEELWLKLHHNSEKSLAPFSKEHLKKIILQLNK
jgi:glycosyltransferase involved in cell wall biosynthesis